jgi:hypothetical protein
LEDADASSIIDHCPREVSSILVCAVIPATRRNLPQQATISKHREKTMKIRAVVILIGLAISFALLVFSQEKEDVKPFPFTPIPAGPQLVQQIEALNQKFDEAFNKHDAAAVGALYTSNAVQTTPQGSFSGREAIEGYITDLFQRHNPSDRVTKMSYVYAFGGDLCALGGWTVTIDGSK